MGQYPCFCAKGKKKKGAPRDEGSDEELADIAEISPQDVGLQNIAVPFSYEEIAAATENFSSESLIRQAMVGPVFKGTLRTNDQVVAIQMLNPEEGIEGANQFMEEVQMLTKMRHDNLINLIGYCNEGDKRILVSEFVPSESNLEVHLHARTPEMQPLDWKARMNIAAGVARGLNFLHIEAIPPVVYRDLRSSNVLLTGSLDPKLADVRRPGADHQSEASSSTAVVDTGGYYAPEYTASGKLTSKSDVYSFGILMLELITGQRAFDGTHEGRKALLIERLRPKIIDWRFNDILDPVLKGKCSKVSLEKAMKLAWPCTREEPQLRPTMAEAVQTMQTVMTELNQVRRPEGEGGASNAGGVVRQRPGEGGASNAGGVVRQRPREGGPGNAGEARQRSREGRQGNAGEARQRSREGRTGNAGETRQRSREGRTGNAGEARQRSREGGTGSAGEARQRSREGGTGNAGEGGQGNTGEARQGSRGGGTGNAGEGGQGNAGEARQGSRGGGQSNAGEARQGTTGGGQSNAGEARQRPMGGVPGNAGLIVQQRFEDRRAGGAGEGGGGGEAESGGLQRRGRRQ